MKRHIGSGPERRLELIGLEQMLGLGLLDALLQALVLVAVATAAAASLSSRSRIRSAWASTTRSVASTS